MSVGTIRSPTPDSCCCAFDQSWKYSSCWKFSFSNVPSPLFTRNPSNRNCRRRKVAKKGCQAQFGRQESRGGLRIGQKNVGSYSVPSSSRSAPRSMDSHWTLAWRINVCRCRWDWYASFKTPELSKIPFKHRKSLHFQKYQMHQLQEKLHPVGNENKCKQIPSKPKMRAEHKIFKLFVHGTT